VALLPISRWTTARRPSAARLALLQHLYC
jgi:hypothetical protein